MKEFLKRKNIVFSARRYGIDALGAMAQGLFCSLLIGTIVKTLGQQLNLPFLVQVGGYCSSMSGPAMAVAIGYALQAPPLVLFSLATVGYAANSLGSTTLSGAAGAGGVPVAHLEGFGAEVVAGSVEPGREAGGSNDRNGLAIGLEGGALLGGDFVVGDGKEMYLMATGKFHYLVIGAKLVTFSSG